MKTMLAKANTTSGVELRVYDDEGKLSQTIGGVRISKDKIAYELPINPSNRKFVNIKNFLALNVDELELAYKESRTYGPRTEMTERKPLEDYLEGEDRETYLALVEKAKKAREEAHKKPMTELEKARAVYEKALAKYNSLMAKEDN